jgi:hypothetical protein
VEPIKGSAKPVSVVVTESLCGQQGGDGGQIRMLWWMEQKFIFGHFERLPERPEET